MVYTLPGRRARDDALNNQRFDDVNRCFDGMDRRLDGLQAEIRGVRNMMAALYGPIVAAILAAAGKYLFFS